MKNENIFEYDSYCAFVRAAVKRQERGGRGELLRLAKHAGVHTSTLSQILGGRKHFTFEQASLVADYLGLKKLETRFFLLLVHKERAGTNLLKKQVLLQIDELRKQEQLLVDIIPQDRPLNEEEKAIFYSNWFYSAIWAQTSIPGFGSRESLHRYFNLPKRLVNNVVAFLLRTGLCVEKSGILQPGHKYSHLEAESPLISRHHGNWRIKAMERHPYLSPAEICYSSPLTLSKKDAEKIKKILIELISEVNSIREPSPCEELRCLNIDWVKI